jgi:iron(II)-dependent oxidoreductase
VISKTEIAAELDAARRRSLTILEPVPVRDQARQVSELMSPLCWDLAHIGHYEELWLVRELTGAAPTVELYDDVYDAFKHPRRDRPSLPILDPAGAREFDADVRKRTLDVLDTITLDRASPLLVDGFVYGMVAQHEHQHDETMLATIQLMDDFVHPSANAANPGAAPTAPPHDVVVTGGTFVVGADGAPWAYDNERPAHEVTVPSFRIDTTAVSNGAYRGFIDAGGYDAPELWTEAGWAWRTQADLHAPGFWARDGSGTWTRRRFGHVEAVPDDEPVQHVSWYEADAFARWSGARLPTEEEWECAAMGSSVGASNLWRDADHRFGPSTIGSRPDTMSRWGAHQMLGDVWEWTASDFRGYPGFRSFPYREYSEVFFGSDYKVLRGGSWATHPTAARTTFRNWDYPIRRQIFAGFRCARDVSH